MPKGVTSYVQKRVARFNQQAPDKADFKSTPDSKRKTATSSAAGSSTQTDKPLKHYKVTDQKHTPTPSPSLGQERAPLELEFLTASARNYRQNVLRARQPTSQEVAALVRGPTIDRKQELLGKAIKELCGEHSLAELAAAFKGFAGATDTWLSPDMAPDQALLAILLELGDPPASGAQLVAMACGLGTESSNIEALLRACPSDSPRATMIRLGLCTARDFMSALESANLPEAKVLSLIEAAFQKKQPTQHSGDEDWPFALPQVAEVSAEKRNRRVLAMLEPADTKDNKRMPAPGASDRDLESAVYHAREHLKKIDACHLTKSETEALVTGAMAREREALFDNAIADFCARLTLAELAAAFKGLAGVKATGLSQDAQEHKRLLGLLQDLDSPPVSEAQLVAMACGLSTDPEEIAALQKACPAKAPRTELIQLGLRMALDPMRALGTDLLLREEVVPLIEAAFQLIEPPAGKFIEERLTALTRKEGLSFEDRDRLVLAMLKAHPKSRLDALSEAGLSAAAHPYAREAEDRDDFSPENGPLRRFHDMFMRSLQLDDLIQPALHAKARQACWDKMEELTALRKVIDDVLASVPDAPGSDTEATSSLTLIFKQLDQRLERARAAFHEALHPKSGHGRQTLFPDELEAWRRACDPAAPLVKASGSDTKHSELSRTVSDEYPVPALLTQLDSVFSRDGQHAMDPEQPLAEVRAAVLRSVAAEKGPAGQLARVNAYLLGIKGRLEQGEKRSTPEEGDTKSGPTSARGDWDAFEASFREAAKVSRDATDRPAPISAAEAQRLEQRTQHYSALRNLFNELTIIRGRLQDEGAKLEQATRAQPPSRGTSTRADPPSEA